MHSLESVTGCECETEEARRCVVFLSQQCEIVFVDICSMEF